MKRGFLFLLTIVLCGSVHAGGSFGRPSPFKAKGDSILTSQEWRYVGMRYSLGGFDVGWIGTWDHNRLYHWFEVDTLYIPMVPGGYKTLYIEGNLSAQLKVSADTLRASVTIADSGRFTNKLISDSARIANFLGTTYLTNGAGGTLLGGNFSMFGNAVAGSNPTGFRFPQALAPAPTIEGAAQWDTDDNNLKVGDASSTKTIWPIGGSPAAYYYPAYTTGSPATVAWRAYTFANLTDVDYDTSATDGQVMKYRASDGKWVPANDLDTAGAAAGRDSIYVKFQGSHSASGYYGLGDTLKIDTTGTGGGESLLDTGLTRDTVKYTGSSQLLFTAYDQGDSTAVAAGANTYLKLDNPIVVSGVAQFGNTVYGDAYIAPFGADAYFTAAAGRSTYVGSGTLAAADLYLNYGSVAGSAIRFYNNTTQMWRIDGDTLIGRGAAYSTIRDATWAGASLTLSQLAQSSASAGQVPKWSGTAWVPGTDNSGGLWTYTGTLSQWFTAGGDSLLITIDTLGDSVVIHSNCKTLLNGGTGTPTINFGTEDLDSVTYDSILAVARAWLVDSNRITNGEFTTAISGGAVTVDNLYGDVTDQGYLDVGIGGTGVSSLTDGGILIGNGTGGIVALAVATNGQIPIGDGTTDPVLATITGGDGVTVTNGAGTITVAVDTTEVPITTLKGGLLSRSDFDDSLNSQLNIVDVEFTRWGAPFTGTPDDSLTQYPAGSVGTFLWNARTEFAEDNATDTINAAVLIPEGVTRGDTLWYAYKVSDSVADSVKIDSVAVNYGAFGSAATILAGNGTDQSPADTNITTGYVVVNSNAVNARGVMFIAFIVEGDNGESISIGTTFLRASRKEL